MKTFTLRTLIDDILLIVRNNNISESEDFSRSLIASWVLAYKAFLRKELLEQKKTGAQNDDWFDDSSDTAETIGPLILEDVKCDNEPILYAKKTVDEISDLQNDDPKNIIAVFDQYNCPILYMHGQRRHFHFFRKYTAREYTYDYVNKHIIIQGGHCCLNLTKIWVKLIKGDDVNAEDANEDDVTIPGWMIPRIKELIFKNELAFMIKMPSDDDNNSTLDGIKPQTPNPYGKEDQEK